MRKIIIAALLCFTATCNSQAEKSEKAKTNPGAIPPVITPEDTDLDLTAEKQIMLLSRKKADWILKDMKVGGKPIPSSYDKKIEQLQREKFDASPRQTIPLKDCIKPNNVIDNDVQECMNGRSKKAW